MSYVFHMYTMEYHMHITTYAQQIVCDNAYRSAVYLGHGFGSPSQSWAPF